MTYLVHTVSFAQLSRAHDSVSLDVDRITPEEARVWLIGHGYDNCLNSGEDDREWVAVMLNMTLQSITRPPAALRPGDTLVVAEMVNARIDFFLVQVVARRA